MLLRQPKPEALKSQILTSQTGSTTISNPQFLASYITLSRGRLLDPGGKLLWIRQSLSFAEKQFPAVRSLEGLRLLVSRILGFRV